MPFPQSRTHTSEDYWNLPEGKRAELIEGGLYAMAPPDFIHQRLAAQLTKLIGNYIDAHNGDCVIIPAPFAVNLDASDKNWVEPDISVICDKQKLTAHGCLGAPDWIVEIVSPSSRKMDYNRKNALYSEAGVREYWIIDPAKEKVTVYFYQEDADPVIYTFNQVIYSGIYRDLSIIVSELLK
ncbi:Uma2 family endonuclease [Clostridium sp. MCC353]|uniref:Uma2 family endonuclease n=1 Tax=Clostridium sp. MCC353 TaxID=2592646 RepID=UPI001C014DA1|nr:Uma2 family endonuclease [Clostridium sp. MCC353]MBT9778915.1 Uma2 family endonuclease [Clostridium sp. MCC353]